MDCEQRLTCRDCLSEDSKCFWVRTNLSASTSFCLEDLLRPLNNSSGWLQPGNYVDCLTSQSIVGGHRRVVSAEELRLAYVILGLSSLLLLFLVLCIVAYLKPGRPEININTTPIRIRRLPIVCEDCNQSFQDAQLHAWVRDAEPQSADTMTTIDVPDDLIRASPLPLNNI